MNLHVEVIIDCDSWWASLPDPGAVCHDAVDRVVALEDIFPFFETETCFELSILLTDNDKIRALNRYHRGHDYPTDVLSFPQDFIAQHASLSAFQPVLLGDVVLAYSVAFRDAERHQISLKRHVMHLVIHGVLHLLDYDHHTDKDADHMEALERCALENIE